MSCDCNVTSDDADNPNIKCTRKEVKETCRFIRWVMTIILEWCIMLLFLMKENTLLQHMSRDCNVTSDDADNSNTKCTRKKHVKETRRFIRWVMTTSEQNGNIMLCIKVH